MQTGTKEGVGVPGTLERSTELEASKSLGGGRENKKEFGIIASNAVLWEYGEGGAETLVCRGLIYLSGRQQQHNEMCRWSFLGTPFALQDDECSPSAQCFLAT